MSIVPLSELLLSHEPETQRAEVLVDPALPHVPGDQRETALETARDVAAQTLYERGCLPSQSLESLFARPDWWGRLCRLAYDPRLRLVRMAITVTVTVVPVVATGAELLQIYAMAALGVALAVTVDTWVHGRVHQADDRAIDAEAHRLLAQSGLAEVLPTR